MEFVVIDFETTGYEDGNVNEPWQLGMAHVIDGEIVEIREWFFATRGDMTGKPTIVELFEDWSAALIGKRLVAHNIATERTILTRIAPLTKWGPWVDTLKLCKAKYPKLPSYALGDLCAMFGLIPQIANRTWHDGLYDAIACANLANFLSPIM